MILGGGDCFFRNSCPGRDRGRQGSTAATTAGLVVEEEGLQQMERGCCHFLNVYHYDGQR
jgi:hypothetical protein